MDPITIGLIGAAVIPIITSLIGKAQSEGLNEKERAELERALGEFDRINVPELKELVAEQLGPSAMGGVQTDPRYKDAQLRALDELQRFGASTGLTLEDQAALEESSDQARRAAGSSRRAIAQQMAARGAGGGGQELAMQLQGASDATDRAYRSSRDAYAHARNRALESMVRAGSMGGEIRGQEFGEQAAKARATDDTARWNASQRARVGEINQRLPMDRFQARLALASAKAHPRGQIANTYGRAAERERDFWTGLGEVGSSAAQGAGQYAQGAGARAPMMSEREWLAAQKARGG
jgi:hypothetical protein